MLRRRKKIEEPLTEFDGPYCIKMPTTTAGMIKLAGIEYRAQQESFRRGSFFWRWVRIVWEPWCAGVLAKIRRS